MKRNRSIRTLPIDDLNLFRPPLPESSTYNNETLYFGEEIAKESPPDFERIQLLSSDGSDLILTSVRDVDNSKSSSSSLSWGGEFKSEASKKVRDELELMDQVLRGVEPIPDYYDHEEYKEWMEFFPNLCVFGTKTGTYREMSKEESLVGHPVVDLEVCDNPQGIIKKTVNQIYAPKVTLNDSIDVDSFLKVSPLGGSLLHRRQSSSRSLISSQISSSKWLKDEEYNSLPCLPGKNGKKVPRSILKNSLVLPPIETSQFRSISATPRRDSKSLSALQKYSGFKRNCK